MLEETEYQHPVLTDASRFVLVELNFDEDGEPNGLQITSNLEGLDDNVSRYIGAALGGISAGIEEQYGE